jgi:transcriptional regulator GlxA family with amidase domain
MSSFGQVPDGNATAYFCTMCRSECDEIPFDKPGNCTHCGMVLVKETHAQRKAALEKEKAEREKNRMTVCFYLQDGVEVLDFAGPMEVFSYAGFKVFTVSKKKDPIISQGILKVIPDYTIENAPEADIMAFFGGNAGNASSDKAVIDWVVSRQAKTKYFFSVCTGAFILGEAGLLNGKTATTFHESIDNLRKRYPQARVLSDVRFVDNGQLITTAGISAGIDGALHLVSKIKGEQVAKETARYMEYDKWKPGEGLILSEK